MSRTTEECLVARYLLDTSEYYFDLAMEEVDEMPDKEYNSILKEVRKHEQDD